MINSKSYPFIYTGAVQTWTVPSTGIYKLECFGAAGGVGYGSINPFGLGGYAAGEIKLTKGEILYLYIGEDGVSTLTTRSFNGGGASAGSSGHNGGRGGGASDIRRGTDSLTSRMIVAGGGGGAQPSCGGFNTTAGHGGGLVGTQSYNKAGGYANSYANGGSQISGGTAYNTSGQWATQGTLGLGANSQTCGAGGGGGYYGGGATYTAGGGGGSSYIALLANATTTSGIQSGNGKILISSTIKNTSVLEKDNKFYITDKIHYDIYNNKFVEATIDEVMASSIATTDINKSFVINGETILPSSVIDFNEYKLCILSDSKLKQIDIDYTPLSAALSKTAIKIKKKYTSISENINNPFFDINATDKSNINYSLDFELANDVVNKNATLLNSEILKSDLYLSFKLNSTSSLLKSAILYNRDTNKYSKIGDDDLNVSNDYINTFVTFEKEYKEVLINRITKQNFKYITTTLEKF